MTVFQTLAIVIAVLDAAAIPHMLAGSLASSYHGEPRATQDVDLVIDPPSPQELQGFAALLDTDRFYVPDVGVAYAHGEPFHVIDTDTGWKVDLILRRDRPFSRMEFSRRRAARIEDIEVFVATAEDTILAKLECARLGQSEGQLADVAAIVRTSSLSLDRAYLHHWADEFGVQDLVDDALRTAE